ncbi:MAG TPA: T9SS type A sorting domain-containing protein [Clostridiales bacterium]|nr:T9SS type A sorting domain-containing protein [Clostridiales bacterium]
MKLGFDDETMNIFYTEQHEIYITSYTTDEREIVFVSKDYGNSWDSIPKPNTITSIYLRYIDKESNTLIVNDPWSTLYSTTIDTINWKILGIAADMISNNIYNCKGHLYSLHWGGVAKSNKDWSVWSQVLSTGSAETFNGIVVDSAGTLYAGSTDFIGDGGLYKSYDNGDTWAGPGPDLLNDFIRAMKVDSEGRIFVGTAGHATLGTGRIYRSENNGLTWKKVAGEGFYVNTIGINSEDEIFVGLCNELDILGLAYSDNHGDTWTFLNSGLEQAIAINEIAISHDGYVYLATDGGVYRSVKSTTGIEHNNSGHVSDFELYQNYPNPFNNETIISFTIKEISEVRLSVYNIKGEFIKDLCDEKLNKGKHEYSFKADELNSGVYLYRLSINGGSEAIKKMIYLR